MISLKGVDKYFNKHKKNQIHVINNISLELSNIGLVALLGPSGCGKTTLLNTIGGLDRPNKGKIYINNKKITSKLDYFVDKNRNINIGYIFQDYKLIDSMSVFDNVALVLKMLGIKNKKEIKERVEYVLNKVGLLRYKKRLASMLSGGERQRLGIARAIVKDPEIILADEPTGNLDSKNSLEIMKLIKLISKEKLVVLVTHEKELALFYADRIVEIKDGEVIKDYINDGTKKLNYKLENNFYLKDFKSHAKTTLTNFDVDFYSEKFENIKLDIVFKNGNIYIKTDKDHKIEVVDESSEIEFIDDKYKEIENNDSDIVDFNIQQLKIDKKKKYSSIYNFFSLIINGFKGIYNYSILKKFLLIGFFISGIFIIFSISSILATFDIKDADFIKCDPNYLFINKNNINTDEIEFFEQLENKEFILPGDSMVKFAFRTDDYYQSKDFVYTLEASAVLVDLLKEKKLLLGRMPDNDYEIVIDKMVLQNFIESNEGLKMVGISSYLDFLNRELKIPNMDNFLIVGIVDLKKPSIYLSQSIFYDVIYNMEDIYFLDAYSTELNIDFVNYELVKNKINVVEGRLPSNLNEIIVDISLKDIYPLFKETDKFFNKEKLYVVGYSSSEINPNVSFISSSAIKKYDFLNFNGISIYTKSKNIVNSNLSKLEYNVKDTYLVSKNKYEKSLKESNNIKIIISVIFIMVSIIELYLIIRSSFLSRIKEIGILRAIGVKKTDILKIFISEIFSIVTLCCIPGILFMYFILSKVIKIESLCKMFYINKYVILVSILFSYIFNLIIGLYPVYRIIKKKPAKILSRADVE